MEDAQHEVHLSSSPVQCVLSGRMQTELSCPQCSPSDPISGTTQATKCSLYGGNEQYLASSPGPAQVFIDCSIGNQEKLGGTWEWTNTTGI